LEYFENRIFAYFVQQGSLIGEQMWKPSENLPKLRVPRLNVKRLKYLAERAEGTVTSEVEDGESAGEEAEVTSEAEDGERLSNPKIIICDNFESPK
jgi:hypothetical protein